MFQHFVLIFCFNRMIIEELTDPASAAWDAYVHDSPTGLPQHLSGWRAVLRKTYGYATHYLLARREDSTAAIVGVLPLFFVRSWLTGHTAMTMPGGLCADNAEVALALVQQAQSILGQAKIGRLVVQDTRQAWPGPWPTASGHVNWRMAVPQDEEILWKKLDRNIRRQIRLARENQLHAVVERSPRLLDDFYAVFSRFTHQSGTPVFAKKFLEQVVKQFPDGYKIAVVYKAEQPIGGYFQLELGDTVYGVWGATLHEYLALRPVYLAYWEILADAVAHKFAYLDMGRSPIDSNASAFKRQWGGVCVPVYQQVVSLASQPSPSLTNQTQTDARFRMFRQLWPKFPFALAQFLGPKLRRHIPFA